MSSPYRSRQRRINGFVFSRERLGETNYQFLKTLAEALSDTNSMPHLDEFP